MKTYEFIDRKELIQELGKEMARLQKKLINIIMLTIIKKWRTMY